MRISQHLITSIPSYRKHFNFRCIWNQLDVFIRDMSPDSIYYPDQYSQDLYDIVANPSRYTKEYPDSKGLDKYFKINEASVLDSPILKDEDYEKRLCIIALFELAGISFNEKDYSKDILISDGDTDIVLSHGQTLKVSKTESTEKELLVRPIKVDNNSSSACTIGEHTIPPGTMVYGIFSACGLHHVIENSASNDVYDLYLSATKDGVRTIVKNKVENTVRHLNNVVSFCVVGNNDYAYIANDKVYCGNNPVLAKRLARQISIFDEHVMVKSDSENLYITMTDGSQKTITIN